VNIGKSIKRTASGFLFSSLLASGWGFAEAGKTSGSGVVYTNKSLSPAIYSYRNIEGAVEPAKAPLIVYVTKAYSQAIYSYPRVGPDTVTAFNVEYVDPAYGQAIYSYPHAAMSRSKPALSWLRLN